MFEFMEVGVMGVVISKKERARMGCFDWCSYYKSMSEL
jgi:hypothetical protein